MGTMHPRRPFANLFSHELEQPDELHLRTTQLRRALRHVRRFTRKHEDAMTHEPLALIGLVGGAGFVLGALTGSRLARGLAAIGIGYLIAKLHVLGEARPDKRELPG